MLKSGTVSSKVAEPCSACFMPEFRAKARTHATFYLLRGWKPATPQLGSQPYGAERSPAQPGDANSNQPALLV